MMNSFRQICDKPCNSGILQAKWSPLHDLVAVITTTGDIRLHRMHWQKVWVITPKDSPAICCSWKTTSHSWKNSAKLLAVGHQNGDVSFIEIEKAVSVHTLHLGSGVTYLDWVHTEVDQVSHESHLDFLPEIRKEELAKYLAQGHTMSSEIQQQCYLTVATEDGKVRIYLDGIFLLLCLSLDDYPVKFYKHMITSTNLSLSTGILTVISKSTLFTSSGEDQTDDEEDGEPPSAYYIHQFHCQSLLFSSRELSLVSRSYTQLHFLLKRSQKVLNQLSDSSEDISLKINSKLEKLDKLLDGTESSVAAEFTIAYATGETSSELETFLTQNLTTKGLKQIEQSVQLAYASMHSDVSEELVILIQHIMVYIQHIYGMSKWTEKFASLGLKEELVLDCLNRFAIFEMKILKLLEVISSDMEDFSIFFTWLTCLCYQVTSSEMQPNFPQLSFKEFDSMVNFLEHRLKKTSPDGTFNLERISYFFNQKIAETSKDSGGSGVEEDENEHNTWYEYMKSKPCLKDHPMILTAQNRTSLLVQFQKFEESFEGIFDGIHRSLSTRVSCVTSLKLFNVADGHDESCAPVVSFMRKTGTEEGVVDAVEKENLTVNRDGEKDNLKMILLACSCDSDRLFLLDITSSDDGDPSKSIIKIGGLSIETSLSSSLSPNDEQDIGGGNDSTMTDDLPQYTMRFATFYGDTHLSILYERSDPQDDEGNQSMSILSQLPLDEMLQKVSFVRQTNTLPAVMVNTEATGDQLTNEDAGIQDGILDQDLGVEWCNIKDMFSEERSLDNLHGSVIDVNAKRSVGCVVASNRRRIRILDMESTEDDDEEDENHDEDESRLSE